MNTNQILVENMDSNTSDLTNNTQSETEKHWVFRILSIPQIGGLLTTVITFGPAAVFSLAFILLSETGESSTPGPFLIFMTASLISLMLLITWWWLNYLEAKIRLEILLPIPFLKIPLKWILYPFMLPFFGIRSVYRLLILPKSQEQGESHPN